MTAGLRPSTILTLRLLVVFGLIAAMPLLAIPSVNTMLGCWLSPAVGWSVASPTSTATEEAGQAEPTTDVAVESISAGKPSVSSAPPPLERTAPVERPDPSFQMREIQVQLQQLGASYMILQRIGSEGSSYHFRCLMPLPGTGVYELPFKATDPDPVRAMERVLGDVESWSSAATRTASEGARTLR